MLQVWWWSGVYKLLSIQCIVQVVYHLIVRVHTQKIFFLLLLYKLDHLHCYTYTHTRVVCVCVCKNVSGPICTTNEWCKWLVNSYPVQKECSDANGAVVYTTIAIFIFTVQPFHTCSSKTNKSLSDCYLPYLTPLSNIGGVIYCLFLWEVSGWDASSLTVSQCLCAEYWGITSLMWPTQRSVMTADCRTNAQYTSLGVNWQLLVLMLCGLCFNWTAQSLV